MQKYSKIQYERYFCVPACLKAILSCNGLGEEIDIWTIGKELDLRIPINLSNKYPNTKTSLKNIFEINLHKEENSINHFFKKYNLPFKETYFYRTSKESIYSLLKKFHNSDIIICFDYPTIANMPDKRWGHVSLITKFNEKQIFIQDPSSIQQMKINYKILSKAIQKQSKIRRGGFWIISKESGHTI